MRNIILYLSVLFLHPAETAAQTKPDECLQRLREICRNEQAQMKKSLLEGQSWHMSYSLETRIFNPYKETITPSKTDGEVLASKNIRYTKTPLVEVFLDDKDVFTVDKQKKIVTHTSTPHNALEFVSPYFDVLSDSVFKVYKMAGCLKVKDQNKTVTRYDIVAIEKQKCPYTKVSFYIEDGAATFYKIYTELNPLFSKDIRSTLLVIKEQGYRPADAGWYPVRKKLFAGANLKASYSKYKYKDLITTKTASKSK
ncbi:MAG: hypothetical protein EOP56_18900 [Sphingobacteriales bacterium]|nr:MAG: hypothetical protein EOP56_18900 [Sphingobacteriales bacterium]